MCCQIIYCVIETNHFETLNWWTRRDIGTFWIAKQIKKKEHETQPLFTDSKTNKKREKKLPDLKNRKNTTTHEFSFFLCDIRIHLRDIRRLQRHWRKFSFQKNIHKEKLFSWRRKTLKYFVLRSHKRKKNLLASKTIFYPQLRSGFMPFWRALVQK